MEKFKIETISNKEIFEQLGTKEKFWYDNSRFLFKIGRENTLENCSEKIAYEIAKIIGLPCAEYEQGVNFSSEAKESCFYWIDKIARVENSQYREILDKMPPKFILRENQKNFILEMPRINTQRLKKIKE